MRPEAHPPIELLTGSVVHARLRPVAHRFSYGLFWILVDIDRLDEASRVSPLFSADRPNLVCFRVRDHGPADGGPLRPWVEAQLAARGVLDRPRTVRLLCLPRVLGYAFNPLSVFLAYDHEGRLAATLYEVRNTHGERHAYVEPAGGRSDRLDHERPKAFRVSPFLPNALTYRFAGALREGRLRLRISARDGKEVVLATALRADAVPFTTGSLVAALARLPLMTFKVVAAIHWQALRLWLKGVPVRSREPGGALDPGRSVVER